MNYSREAHQASRGSNHQFTFARRNRTCDYCSRLIDTDFMVCNSCPQNENCYDLVRINLIVGH